MPPKGAQRRGRRINAEGARQCWRTLSFEEQLSALRFEDAELVERIRTALQTLWEKQALMEQLGLVPIVEGSQADPFESSVLLKQTFEFTWNIARSAHNPNMVLVDPHRHPVMAVKRAFLEEHDILEVMEAVLPDFLSDNSSRVQLPQARWKEIFANDPSTVLSMEQQLAKVVEQSLLQLEKQAKSPAQEQEAASSASAAPAHELVLEPWMAEFDAQAAKAAASSKKKRKQAKTKALVARPLETMTEEPERDRTAPQVLRDHYWRSPSVERTDDAAEQVECPLRKEMQEHQVGVLGHKLQDMDMRSDSPRSVRSFSESACSEESLPSSPRHSQEMAANPPQLVNYLWGQSSQLTGEPVLRCHTSPRTCSTSTPGIYSDCSTTPSIAGTPWNLRGSWAPNRAPPQTPTEAGSVAVVVKNTFIDVEEHNNRGSASNRLTKSMPPVAQRCVREELDETDPWCWYWH
mmetsp:Transcript_16058/g.36849  ORF Transcript_16058/g.36849 Transcript_16058/m.36849 type:complete len:463 (+) Transcript_16058:78-1466(+)